jgi:hypothetical protein
MEHTIPTLTLDELELALDARRESRREGTPSMKPADLSYWFRRAAREKTPGVPSRGGTR